MTRIHRVASVALCFFVLAFGLASPARADYKDLQVQVALPAAAELGAYTGATRFVVGEVTDLNVSETPSHVGMGPQSIYEIVTDQPRADVVRNAITEAFNRTGLIAPTPSEATYTVDVTLRRYMSQTHLTFSRFRLRSEVFLEFNFKRNGVSEGRVLACGNAQEYAQIATQAKYTEVYQTAFNDAVFKLLNSKTLARVAGEGWKPVAAPTSSGRNNAVRISKDEFYGPTDTIQGHANQAAQAMQAGSPASPLSLPDFQLDEVTGKVTSPVAYLGYARALVPELVRQHLDAFFPGAITEIQRASPSVSTQGLVVEGKIEDFRVGNFYARSLIGFGAGKDKLQGTINFKDAASGNTLYSFNVLSSNWGAGWQTKKGSIRDMTEQLARDIAYFLVKTKVPNYQPPADLEVMFDATPYPMPQRKS